jgi:type IV pilus assembly protein PilV
MTINGNTMNIILKKIHGFSLIEVMIALLILGVGLLGVASLQSKGFQFSYQAYSLTQANLLAYDIMDRIRANDKLAYQGNYVIDDCHTVNIPTDCNSASCTSEQLVKFDINNWCTNIDKSLPADSIGTIVGQKLNDSLYEYKIHFKWRLPDSEVVGEETTKTLEWVMHLGIKS